MLKLIVPLILAALAGACIVVQQVLNANLKSALNSAALSGVTSYFVGLLCIVAFALAMRDPLPSAAVASRVPWWALSGGFFGAIYIAMAILLVPQLGAATFVAVLIAGQMLGSITIDHFGWLGLAQRPVDLPRLAGVALLMGGVLLIRR